MGKSPTKRRHCGASPKRMSGARNVDCCGKPKMKQRLLASFPPKKRHLELRPRKGGRSAFTAQRKRKTRSRQSTTMKRKNVSVSIGRMKRHRISVADVADVAERSLTHQEQERHVKPRDDHVDATRQARREAATPPPPPTRHNFQATAMKVTTSSSAFRVFIPGSPSRAAKLRNSPSPPPRTCDIADSAETKQEKDCFYAMLHRRPEAIGALYRDLIAQEDEEQDDVDRAGDEEDDADSMTTSSPEEDLCSGVSTMRLGTATTMMTPAVVSPQRCLSSMSLSWSSEEDAYEEEDAEIVALGAEGALDLDIPSVLAFNRDELGDVLYFGGYGIDQLCVVTYFLAHVLVLLPQQDENEAEAVSAYRYEQEQDAAVVKTRDEEFLRPDSDSREKILETIQQLILRVADKAKDYEPLGLEPRHYRQLHVAAELAQVDLRAPLIQGCQTAESSCLAAHQNSGTRQVVKSVASALKAACLPCRRVAIFGLDLLFISGAELGSLRHADSFGFLGGGGGEGGAVEEEDRWLLVENDAASCTVREAFARARDPTPRTIAVRQYLESRGFGPVAPLPVCLWKAGAATERDQRHLLSRVLR